MDHKNENIEFPNQIIEDIDMGKRVKQAFIEYAMSVIVARALPDVRDGMKPGQRRIMYAMYEDHLIGKFNIFVLVVFHCFVLSSRGKNPWKLWFLKVVFYRNAGDRS